MDTIDIRNELMSGHTHEAIAGLIELIGRLEMRHTLDRAHIADLSQRLDRAEAAHDALKEIVQQIDNGIAELARTKADAEPAYERASYPDTCPSCKGTGELRDELEGERCFRCQGTGIDHNPGRLDEGAPAPFFDATPGLRTAGVPASPAG